MATDIKEIEKKIHADAVERFTETAERLKVNGSKKMASLIELGEFIKSIIETLEKTESLFPEYDYEQLRIWRETYELYKETLQNEVETVKKKNREYEARRQARRQAQSNELVATYPSILRHRLSDKSLIDWEKTKLDEATAKYYNSLTTAERNRIDQAKQCALIWASEETQIAQQNGKQWSRKILVADWRIRETLEKLTGRKVQQNEVTEIVQAFKRLHGIWYNFELVGFKDKDGKPLIYSTPLLNIPDGVIEGNGKTAFCVVLHPLFLGRHQTQQDEKVIQEKQVWKPIGALGATACEVAFYGIVNTQTHAKESFLLEVCGLADKQQRNKSRNVLRLQSLFNTAEQNGFIKQWKMSENREKETVYSWTIAKTKNEPKTANI